ncbi:conserved hypothetical protein [Trichinella spiralis]|uniref:hypothetical protein n=1 Tax=Trichinella spiralis TaxID=6334 RepID=UPI0001EFEEB4|nr:conserved hypothetical protein [Trichinella spiralis]
MNPFDCGRYALEQGGQAIVRPNLDWCTERVEKESHSVINVKSTVAIFKQWSNISRLTAFGMTTIIPPFWSMENCSRTCQNGRIAAVRFPLSFGKPLKIICRRSSISGSIAEAGFGLFHRCFSFFAF